MTIKDFKRVARLIKEALKELDEKALSEGVKLFGGEYEQAQEKIRNLILKAQGFTPEEYSEAKTEYLDNREAEKQARNSQFTEVMSRVEQMRGDKGDSPTKEELISLIEPLIPQPEKGQDGLDGRNPMHIGHRPPDNPKIGDLWTKV